MRTSAGGRVEYVVVGSGSPVTVFGHGLGGSILDTRPLGVGVRGTKVFLHFRGHGGSLGDGWSYAGLATDLRAVADETGATRALGVSMGAGALTALLADAPDRFDRVVFYLPAVLDRPGAGPALGRFRAMAGAVEAGDLDGLTALVLTEIPPAVRVQPDARAYAAMRAELLLAGKAAAALRELPGQAAVADAGVLARVGVPALVVAQEDDDLHPVAVARELAAALPDARLEVFAGGGSLWLSRDRLRTLISGFLNAA